QSVAYFGYIQTLPVSQSPYLIDGNFQTVLGSAPSISINTNNYTWEKVNTNGMLAPSQELPAVLGTSAPQQNSADLTTKGWELSLSYRNTLTIASSPFSFNAKFILSDSKSKITKYNNALGTFSAAYREGEEIVEIWGLTNDGQFTTKDEISKL